MADLNGQETADTGAKADTGGNPGDSLVEITPGDVSEAITATDTKGDTKTSDGATERVGVTGEAGEASKTETTTPEGKAEKNESVTPIIDKKLDVADKGSHICSNSRVC